MSLCSCNRRSFQSLGPHIRGWVVSQYDSACATRTHPLRHSQGRSVLEKAPLEKKNAPSKTKQLHLRLHALLEAHRRGEVPTKRPSLSREYSQERSVGALPLPLYPSPLLLSLLLLFPSPQLSISQLLSFLLNLLSGGPART